MKHGSPGLGETLGFDLVNGVGPREGVKGGVIMYRRGG